MWDQVMLSCFCVVSTSSVAKIPHASPMIHISFSGEYEMETEKGSLLLEINYCYSLLSFSYTFPSLF